MSEGKEPDDAVLLGRAFAHVLVLDYAGLWVFSLTTAGRVAFRLSSGGVFFALAVLCPVTVIAVALVASGFPRRWSMERRMIAATLLVAPLLAVAAWHMMCSFEVMYFLNHRVYWDDVLSGKSPSRW